MLSPGEESYLVCEIDGVKQFLSSALSSRSNADTHLYSQLVRQLHVRDDPDTLWKVYIGLSSCVSHFTQKPHEYRDLIDGLLSFDWKGEVKLVVAFMHLLGRMVSANVTFLTPALQLLVKSLLSSPNPRQKEDMEAQALAAEHQRRAHRLASP